MLSGLTWAGTKALGGARFSLVNLMPAAFLVGFFAILAASGLYSGRDFDVGKTTERLGENVGWAIISVFGVFLLAVLLRPFQVTLVRFLEGGWPHWPALNYAKELAIERHHRVRQTAYVVSKADLEPDWSTTKKLHDIAEIQRYEQWGKAIQMRAEVTLRRYPLRWERMMPTLLGNVLRDGEDNAGQRYGLIFAAVAPRMYPSISPKLSTAISENLDLIDTTAAMCIAFAVASVSSLPLVSRWDRWSVIPFVTATLCALSYRGAISIARGHAKSLRQSLIYTGLTCLRSFDTNCPSRPDAKESLTKNCRIFSAVVAPQTKT
ncbi:MAG: hypothetical protein ACRDRU_11705 [Pseudonocardiaceae bacterium]